MPIHCTIWTSSINLIVVINLCNYCIIRHTAIQIYLGSLCNISCITHVKYHLSITTSFFYPAYDLFDRYTCNGKYRRRVELGNRHLTGRHKTCRYHIKKEDGFNSILFFIIIHLYHI